MFTKAEVKSFKKGFHESNTGKSPNAIVGRGSDFGNRSERRRELSSKGLHRNKEGILVVEPTAKFRSKLQIVFVKNAGVYTGEIRKILHWIRM